MLQLIATSTGKINQILFKFSTGNLNNQELYNSISIEHDKLQKKIKNLLDNGLTSSASALL